MKFGQGQRAIMLRFTQALLLLSLLLAASASVAKAQEGGEEFDPYPLRQADTSSPWCGPLGKAGVAARCQRESQWL